MKRSLLFLMMILPMLGFGQSDTTFIFDGENWHPRNPSGKTSDGGDTTFSLIIHDGPDSAYIGATITGADSIIVKPGARLYVDDGAQIFVVDYVRAEAGTSTDSYSQIYGNVGGLVPGYSARYQIFLEDAGAGRWYNIGIPVTGAIADSVHGDAPISTGNPAVPNSANFWYYQGDTANGGEGQFVAVAGGNLPFGRGYQLFAGDGDDWGSGPFTFEVRGNAFVDDAIGLGTAIDSAGTEWSWNLFPNPYPSVIDWEAVYANNNDSLGATYYIQGGEPDTAFDSTNDQVTWHMYNALYGGDPDSSNASRYIAPGMSYFAEFHTGYDEVEFNNSMRVLRDLENSRPHHLRTTPKYEQFALSVEHVSQELQDKTYFMFDDSFSDQKNISVDGTKMMNSGHPNLYTLAGGEHRLAYNGLNDQFTTKTVDLHFQGDHDGMYEIALDQDAIPTSWTVELEDKLTDNTVNLRNTIYTFNHVSTNSEDRFLLHIKKGTTDMEEVDTENMFSYMQDQTLNVSMEGMENATVRVYNVTGQLMVEESDVNNFFETGTDDWSAGVYLIEVESANGSRVYEDKVVKTSR